MHIISVPLTKDNRLSARDVIGNKAKMSKTQDSFFEQVGKSYGLARGIHMDGQEKKQHISAQEHELREIRQTATELQKEVEQLQEERSKQHNSLKLLSASKIDRQKELKKINNTIRQKQHELEAIKGDLEEVKGYLTEAQQNRLAEIDREWDDFELE